MVVTSRVVWMGWGGLGWPLPGVLGARRIEDASAGPPSVFRIARPARTDIVPPARWRFVLVRLEGGRAHRAGPRRSSPSARLTAAPSSRRLSTTLVATILRTIPT